MDKFNYSANNNPFQRPWMQNNCAASTPATMVLQGLVVGGLVGAIVCVVSYPVEFAKTKLQFADDKSDKVKPFKGVYGALKHTVHEKGFLGMYRGLNVMLFFSIPKLGIRFGTFEFLRLHAADESDNLSPLMTILCGLGAGFAEAVCAVTPMETVKVKFIQDHQRKIPEYKGTFHGIRKIVSDHGFKVWYQGMMPTIVRQGTNQAIRFYVMDFLKQKYRDGDQKVVIPTIVNGIFGVIAAFISVVSNTPVDVVKTRMQGLEANTYKNSFDCVKKIYKNEGLKALYKGMYARLIRVCMDVGFTFMIYDDIMYQIKKIWP